MAQNQRGWFWQLIGCVLFAPVLAQATPCDTIPGHFFLRDTFCSNQIILLNGHFYGPDDPSGVDTLPGAAAGGGDSIVHVDLVFLQPTVVNLTQDLCTGDTLLVNGVPYHANHWLGEETVEDGASNGCDSIIYVNLNIVPAPTGFLTDTLCPDNFLIVNQQRYDRTHPEGSEILSGAAENGCDSLVHVVLFFREFCPSTDGLVYAPNAFRPESEEGGNNRFYLSADAGVTQIQRLLILDRWGDLVFLRENFSPNLAELGWDGTARGKIMQPGIYTFRAEMELIDGTRVVKTGEFALIR